VTRFLPAEGHSDLSFRAYRRLMMGMNARTTENIIDAKLSLAPWLPLAPLGIVQAAGIIAGAAFIGPPENSL
jgi:hypothetical protein